MYQAADFEPCGLLTAAGLVVFVPASSGEKVRGDGQGIGTDDLSLNRSYRDVAVSW